MTDRLSDADLDRADELAAKATPGPWQTSYLEEGIEEIETVEGGHVAVADGLPADAEFIAFARTALPALVAEVRDLREREAASEWETEAFRWMAPEQKRRRLVGPWEAVSDDHE